jgi:hypothetical protein
VLVIIDEVTEGDWSARGQRISIASIADSVGLPEIDERYAWVGAYFAAKARQFAATGYPPDPADFCLRERQHYVHRMSAINLGERK